MRTAEEIHGGKANTAIAERVSLIELIEVGGATKNDVGPSVQSSITKVRRWICKRGADHQVVHPVTVHVPCAAHRPSRRFVLSRRGNAVGALEHNARRPIEIRQRDSSIGVGCARAVQCSEGGPAKHQKRLACIEGIADLRPGGTDQEIAVTVGIHVPRAVDRPAGVVARSRAIEHDAGRAIQCAEPSLSIRDAARRHVELCEVRRTAKDEIGLPGSGDFARTGRIGADQEIVESIAIDVARAAHRPAGEVVIINPGQDEASCRVNPVET